MNRRAAPLPLLCCFNGASPLLIDLSFSSALWFHLIATLSADYKVTSSTYKAASASATFTETGERTAGKSVGNVISINPGQLGRGCATAYATVSFSHR